MLCRLRKACLGLPAPCHNLLRRRLVRPAEAGLALVGEPGQCQRLLCSLPPSRRPLVDLVTLHVGHLSENRKDQLPGPLGNETQAMHTHKAIAEACGVAPKTIQRMAQAVKKHGTTDEALERLRGLRWWQVRELTNPDAAGQLSFDEMKDGRIQRRAEVLGKAIGDEAPHIVAEALMLRDPDFAKAVMLQLRFVYLRNNPFNLGPDGLPEFPEDEPEGEPLEF